MQEIHYQKFAEINTIIDAILTTWQDNNEGAKSTKGFFFKNMSCHIMRGKKSKVTTFKC
jgi:hypothetical protein